MTEIKIDLKKLEEAKIIDKETKGKIEAFLKKEKKSAGSNKFLSILTTFGAIITGIGILLFVAANWSDMTNITKTLILIIGTLAFYAGGFLYTEKISGYSKTGQALVLLGSLSYGASIFLFEQMYNIGGNVSTDFLIWSVGVLPLAYVSGFFTIFGVGIITLYLTVLIYLGENTYVGPIFYTLPLLVLGFLSLIVARFHTKSYKSFGVILTFFGLSITLGTLFALTFSDFWKEELWSKSLVENTLYYIVYGGVVLGIATLFWEGWKNKNLDIKENAPFFLSAIGIIGLLYITTSLNIPSDKVTSYDGFFFSVPYPVNLYVGLLNIIFLGLIGTVIFRGIKKENALLVNTAIFFFAVYLFGKYLAFAFDSKLEGSFIFISGGLACIVIGWLSEYVRRRIIQKIKD